MNISELIRQLEAILREHGDLPVYFTEADDEGEIGGADVYEARQGTPERVVLG